MRSTRMPSGTASTSIAPIVAASSTPAAAPESASESRRVGSSGTNATSAAVIANATP